MKSVLFPSLLRYMMQWPGGRILQRHELDAFLAQAVSSQLYEPDQLQELKVSSRFGRSVVLCLLFLSSFYSLKKQAVKKSTLMRLDLLKNRIKVDLESYNSNLRNLIV